MSKKRWTLDDLIKRLGQDFADFETAGVRKDINDVLHDMMPSPKVVMPLNYCGDVSDAIKFFNAALKDWYRQSGDDLHNPGKSFCAAAPKKLDDNRRLIVTNSVSEANAICMAALRILKDTTTGETVQ